MHAEISIDLDKSMVEIKGVLVSICDFERDRAESRESRAEREQSRERAQRESIL